MNPTVKLFTNCITKLNHNRCIVSNSSVNIIYNHILYAKLHQSTPLLAGHSKWANIKHVKAAKDGERAALFARLSRQIRFAIQDGGSSDPAANSALKCAIEIAVKKNMPMASIQTTIKKIESNKVEIKEYILAMKHINRVHMICVMYTDSFANSKMNLAPTLKKYKTIYVDCRHLFEDIGVIETIVQDNFKGNQNLEEICTDDAIEVGAEEVEIIDKQTGLVNFLCPAVQLSRISKDLIEKGYQIESAEHVFAPNSTVIISDEELKFYEKLKEKILGVEGVERIYDNLDPSLNR